MGRGIVVWALWWLGLLWVVVGVVAILYSFTVDGPLGDFLNHMHFAVWVLLAPGIVAMMLSLFLSSRT